MGGADIKGTGTMRQGRNVQPEAWWAFWQLRDLLTYPPPPWWRNRPPPQACTFPGARSMRWRALPEGGLALERANAVEQTNKPLDRICSIAHSHSSSV
jgi:hypothetical protein